MDTDLVSPARFGKSANDREAFAVCVLKPTLDVKFRAGRRACGMNHLFEPDRGWQLDSLPRERRVDRDLSPFRPAPHDGKILLGDPLFLHGQTKTARGGGVFRDENQSARLAIEPVHNRNLPAVGNLEGEQLLQLAPERAHVTRLARMNEEERRFFNDDEVARLGND
jgi:hypothetical protein